MTRLTRPISAQMDQCSGCELAQKRHLVVESSRVQYPAPLARSAICVPEPRACRFASNCSGLPAPVRRSRKGFAALFVGKSSNANMQDGAFLCDATIQRLPANAP